MNLGSVDNRNAEIRSGKKVLEELTHLEIKGSNLEVRGFASVEGIYTRRESSIRKMVLIVPKLDVNAYREKDPILLGEKTDTEILDELTLKIPLENCMVAEVFDEDSDEDFEVEDPEFLESLSGYRGYIDLSIIAKGKPLEAGEYNVFITLEQLDNENENIKYEKVIPLANSRRFLNNTVSSTRLNYYSKQSVMKYNLVASFDNYTKTLRLKSTLLRSYDPRIMDEDDVVQENRYVRAIKKRVFQLAYSIFSMFPIKKNKVVFASDSRTELTGNFFFIYEEMVKREMNLDIKFLLKDNINERKSLRELTAMAYHFATSKVILVDDFYPIIYPLAIRNGADLIQVWHAAGAFKTFGFSRLGRPGGPSPRSRNHRNYTKAAVSSEGVRENYAEGFGITVDKVHATGIPRADIFVDEEYKEYVRSTLYEKYPELKEKKVILFAPTFRGNGQATAHYPFEKLNLKKLYESLSDEYVFVLKIHPFVKNKIRIPYEYHDFFLDFSDYREVNDLLLVTDILITDYSSVCFEFALLNKPMLFFAFDVEEYIESRDFYYDYFDFIPGPLVRDVNQMIDVIQNEEFETEKIQPFAQYFFDDTVGNAAANVIDQLIIPSLNDEGTEEEEEQAILPPAKSRKELFDRTLSSDK
ncbi:CDP-glycerol glycerophosphotransferase family protein [Edaphobacillus lindanitolerans]|uniref:CDP-glycerol:poly(Glycerophosphate) glycerophosphotransferase n=1 Tax=Edaphobacillus lindanitolerans TaxID=550447 RepID=A0A1U7PJP7_9BACI|nr:CDP-glycerol glycerophosphotransferase family protein [Edaphobacillus lindanitolerans]SIT70991.1 CDP-glycerol:poly(glycerophosphate) glycerophosphotransferase [Edaphobacillus lindanitolerans]